MAHETRQLPAQPDIVAPDGSDVRVLLRTSRGSMAHFELAAGRASDAIRHRTVDEIWFVLAGRGEMWRRTGDDEDVVALVPGTCVSIPAGTHFQFRAAAGGSLQAVGVTMPPWPGADEAVPVTGRWARDRG
ncbi:MAG TPA: cupin domain-containing protein [Burkholderiales bacterium]|nr:cupin domain-containing protein [Burkholderiales bacterium]